MSSRNKGLKAAEKVMVILGAGIIVISLLLGYSSFALGVALAAFIAWLFYRWQMIAVINLEGLSPRKATNRLVARSLIRLFVFLGMLGLSAFVGELFLFGVLTGLLLEIMAFIGQAFLIIRGKEG
jgi:sterol desaturase/sphingolipid hydroxylase (fatty acid hydroxylase superfamily)